MVNFVVIVSKFKDFPGYPSTNLLGVPPILEVHMVREYLDLVWRPGEEGSPVAKGFDNS